MSGCASLVMAATLAACGGGERATTIVTAAAPSPVVAVNPLPSVPSPAPTPAPSPAPAPAPAAPVQAPGAPAINMGLIPVAVAGYQDQRIRPANVADPTQNPVPADVGAFREPCGFSHMAFDDPIVYPGQAGRSHLHVFFGNTETNAMTTAASLSTSGASTCAGGTLNRTAYWVPAMIDTRTGAPVAPKGVLVYYKVGYNGIDGATIQPMPAGLRMISGDAHNQTPTSWPVRYGCIGSQTYWNGASIPVCVTGDDMVMSVEFPQCWDGVNLDSPDHKSHMSNPVAGRCPTTHPVPISQVSYIVGYTVKATDDLSRWRLSSDTYDPSLPAGYSGHGDWFNGWDAGTMSTFVSNCEQQSRDCHAYLLGDGRTLY